MLFSIQALVENFSRQGQTPQGSPDREEWELRGAIPCAAWNLPAALAPGELPSVRNFGMAGAHAVSREQYS